jgi:hypothetical protein
MKQKNKKKKKKKNRKRGKSMKMIWERILKKNKILNNSRRKRKNTAI